MNASIEAALYGWCHDCGEGSDVGISRGEARAWIEEHEKWNHEEAK